MDGRNVRKGIVFRDFSRFIEQIKYYDSLKVNYKIRIDYDSVNVKSGSIFEGFFSIAIY